MPTAASNPAVSRTVNSWANPYNNKGADPPVGSFVVIWNAYFLPFRGASSAFMFAMVF